MQRLIDSEFDNDLFQQWIIDQQDMLICKLLAYMGYVGPLNQQPDIVALLVPVENAAAELKYQLARLDLAIFCVPVITADVLKRILKRSNIYVLPNVDDLSELRDKLTNGSFTRKKRETLEGEQETLASLLEVSPSKIRYDHRFDKIGIVGKTGFAYRMDDGSTFIYLQGRSKRHWHAVLADMAFCKLTKNNSPYGRFDGEFCLSGNPTVDQAETLRKRLGIKKSNQSRDTSPI